MNEKLIAVARAIFMAAPPHPLVKTDWDNGAILGRDNIVREGCILQAHAAIIAHLKHLEDNGYKIIKFVSAEEANRLGLNERSLEEIEANIKWIELP